MEPMPEFEPRDSSLFANISNVEQRYMFQDIGEWKKVIALFANQYWANSADVWVVIIPHGTDSEIS